MPKKMRKSRKPLVISDERGLKKLTRIARSLPIGVKTAPLTMAEKIKLIRIKSNATELEKQKQNLQTILQYSNATPLEIYKSIKYRCVFCYCDFDQPGDLKSHSLEEHEKKKLTYMDEHRNMRDFYVKMDVTNLHCSICEEKLSLLDDLLVHLKTVHDKQVLQTLKKPFFQFDFSSPGFICVLCSNVHSSLKALVEHQNTHFRYHICDVCDQGYVTESKLAAHKYRHKTGVFKCEHCDEVFDSSWKRTDHNRKVHMARFLRFKCPYCPMKFAYYRERKAHSLSEHGKEIVPDIKCTACDKVFYHVTALSRHKRKDHLLERRHICEICSMSFFTKQMLADHMIKHTGERLFQCSVCLKAYSRKKTLREHLRIHADDRRFACAHCGQQFVQKCSWKSHMRSKHDEVVE